MGLLAKIAAEVQDRASASSDWLTTRLAPVLAEEWVSIPHSCILFRALLEEQATYSWSGLTGTPCQGKLRLLWNFRGWLHGAPPLEGGGLACAPV